MHRYFVTGTDTDVGKTRVAAALALALRSAGKAPTIVKLVQTGLKPEGEGDAQRAGRLAGVPYAELARFEKAADAWSAAVAQGRPALAAPALAEALAARSGAIVVEGTGGMLAPLSADEHLGHVAASARLHAILTVGLRLGCLNHALLTLSVCRELGLAVDAVLVERWGPTASEYKDDVRRVLQGKVRILGILPFAPGESESVRDAAKLFKPLVNQER